MHRRKFLAAAVGVSASAAAADDTILPNDIGSCEVRDIPLRGFFRHNGELWWRMADPDRPDGLDRDTPTPVQAVQMTGETNVGVPVILPARCWVSRVVVEMKVTRTKDHWE